MNDDTGQDEVEVQRAAHLQFPVVGIGASAGGLDALLQFVPVVETDCGMAFVVVQHLDPDHPSNLTELLSRASHIPVRLVEDGIAVEPATIFVIPPNRVLTLVEGRLRLEAPTEPRGQRNPIDTFLLSLARDQGDLAACAILSGTGSDGTLGLRAIKEGGGLTLAQQDASYEGMMRSAVATGLVDLVLPAQDMPAKLAEYFRQPLGEKNAWPQDLAGETEELVKIVSLMRIRTGNDFKDYKDPTVRRRVQRRMQVLGLDRVAEFRERLTQDPEEVELLFQDLLIGVTSFFRDHDAFAALEQLVIPPLFHGKGADDTIRVWVPGCATGEEAYSIAMLLREARARHPQGARELQIFASDIDTKALDVARLGRYPATIAADMTAERLERHFVREDGTYRVVGELREMCLFSQHNLLRDPPFSRLDLLSCRNLLIYLKPTLQDRVIPLFHYALRDGGFLFLGTSENVSRHQKMFAVADKTFRIFRRRPSADRRLPEFPLSSVEPPTRPAPAAELHARDASLRDQAERAVLERYGPAHLVINGEGDILFASGRTGKYLELASGAPDSNVLTMARTGLRLDLRAALHRARPRGQPVAQSNIVFETEGGRQAIDLVVHPLPTSGSDGDQLYLVIFQDLGGVRAVGAETVETAEAVEAATVQRLEIELRESRERLQSTAEELESSNEELKSSNEELQSANEELQSANEELETSREELQSINEELQTVNAELNARVDELSRLHSDMVNLLESTQIATVFIDRNFAVKGFTPAAKDLFHLVESDVGRPIGHVRARFRHDTVQDDAERVLRTLAPLERPVDSLDGAIRFVMRMLPYRTVDNVISGVVITFTDVSRITAAEAQIQALTRDLRHRVESLERLLDLVPAGILLLENGDGQRLRANRHATMLLGLGVEPRGLAELSVSGTLLVNGESSTLQGMLERTARTGEEVSQLAGQILLPGNGRRDVLVSATPLFEESGRPRGAIAAIADIAEQKRAEAHQEALLHELQHRVKNILATVSSLASRMLRTTTTLEGFAEPFLERLRAMGNMHELLARDTREGADLEALVLAALEPYDTRDGTRFSVEGPPVHVPPNIAATLGMVLHELTTNAAKYGALAPAGGRLHVAWALDDADLPPRLRLRWREHAAGAVKPPEHEGFGTSFVRRAIEYELAGSVKLDFAPDGLHATFTVPLGSAAGHAPAAALASQGSPSDD